MVPLENIGYFAFLGYGGLNFMRIEDGLATVTENGSQFLRYCVEGKYNHDSILSTK